MNSTPYPKHYPTLYVNEIFPRNPMEICRNFQAPPEELDTQKKIVPMDKHPLVFVNWMIPSQKEVPYMDIATEEMIWASPELPPKFHDFEDHEPLDQCVIMFEIRPHYVDGVYVADLSVSEEYHSKCHEKSDRMTHEQWGKCFALKGIRVVTLEEYVENRMEFKHPQYLIHKPIRYDEVQRIYRFKSKDEVEKSPGTGLVEVLTKK